MLQSLQGILHGTAVMDKDLAHIFLQENIGDLQTTFRCSQINLIVTPCGYEFGN